MSSNDTNRWTYDRGQGMYVSPDRRHVAQREPRGRWSLWRLREGVPPSRARPADYALVCDLYRTLGHARWEAEESIEPL